MSIEVAIQSRVATVTINRPEALNACSSDLLSELHDALFAVAADDAVGCVVLTGAGEKAFIAGADIAEMSKKTPIEARAFAERGHAVANLLEEMRKPTIAAVNGFALGGGCELALACDLRFCSENARFGQPEINLGIIPGWGGTQRLARATTIGFAKELIFTGRLIDAQEALARGVVNAVYPLSELLSAVLEIARTIGEKGAIAMAYAKEATDRALDGDMTMNLVHEADLFALLFATEDTREGLTAFVDKRKPRFIGR